MSLNQIQEITSNTTEKRACQNARSYLIFLDYINLNKKEMKKTLKNALMTLALLAMPFAMQAQTKFHDVEANDAKGAVKSLTVSMMGQEQKTTFTQDGKMQQDGLKDAVYDDNGYIQSAKMEAQGMSVTINFKWEDGKVKTQTTNVMGQQMATTNVYNDKGEIIKQSIDMGGQAMSVEYSDYKYDDKGNWISRKASVMGQTMEAPRKIEYYE